MAELATIARPYAEALFKAVSAADAPSVAGQISELAAIAASPQLRQFADSPKTEATQVFDLVTGVVRVSLGDAMRNFLRTVIDNGRLEALPEMAAQFHRMVNSRSGVSDAVVYSAFAIEPQQLAELAQTLEQRFGRKLQLTVQIDSALIGGIRVVVGDEVLDTSVKARLEQMKVALTA
jgi:F-type H+-transporting ATPase subunit delta